MRNRVLLALALVVAMLSSSPRAATVSQFTLFGSAAKDFDPENALNEVVSINPHSTPPGCFTSFTCATYDFGGIRVPLPAGTKATDLDNQLSVKYYFVSATACFGGSPRFQLKIDKTGDGETGDDFNAFGYLAHSAYGGACVTGAWDFADMTDSVAHWDLGQGGLGQTLTWAQVETDLAATYPGYQILRGALVEDGNDGPAYYDLLTIGNSTFDGYEDLTPSGPSAIFMGVDNATKGNWIGTYGADGYFIANDSQFNPGYVNAVTLGGQLNFTWTVPPSATDVRALFRGAPNSAQRRAGTWYRATPFTIDIDFADAATHRVELYMVDWDSSTRAQQIQVIDPVTLTVLDTQNVSGFNGGRYLKWDVIGDVRFVVTKTGGVNGVVSAVFFNP